MKKPTLYLSLMIIITAVSPVFAMLNGEEDENLPPQRSIAQQIPLADEKNSDEISGVFTVTGTSSISTQRGFKNKGQVRADSLIINCNGDFCNEVTIQTSHLSIQADNIINRGVITDGSPMN